MSKKSEQKVARVLYMTVLLIALIILVSPFAVPVILAASVSLAMFPLVLKLESKGISRKFSAVIMTTLFTILISIPISFFIAKGTIEVTTRLEKINFNEQLREQGMSGFVSDIRHELVTFAHTHAQKLKIDEFLTKQKIDNYLNVTTAFLLKFFRSILSSLPVVVLFLLVTILCTYSFLKSGRQVRNFLQRIFGFSNSTMDELVKISIKNARSVYVSNIATGAIQSLLIAIGAALTGVGDFFLVFFITLVLAFVPVIGASPVGFVCAGIAYVKGEVTHAIILAVLAAFTGVIDNILRPWLASSGESNIPPIIAFVCVLGGALLLGFPGLFIGLLIGTFAYDTLPIFWREIGRGDHSYVEEVSPES